MRSRLLLLLLLMAVAGSGAGTSFAEPVTAAERALLARHGMAWHPLGTSHTIKVIHPERALSRARWETSQEPKDAAAVPMLVMYRGVPAWLVVVRDGVQHGYGLGGGSWRSDFFVFVNAKTGRWLTTFSGRA